MNKEPIATKHAYRRAKERLGWNKSALRGQMVKAFYHGAAHKDVKSKLRKYVDKLWLKSKNCNNIRIYGENLYLFNNEILITVYRLDNKLIKYTSLLRN